MGDGHPCFFHAAFNKRGYFFCSIFLAMARL